MEGGDNINAIAIEECEKYAIKVYPVRCLNKKCRSKNVKIYKTDLPIRYCKCLDCGHNFKTIEKDDY